MSFYGFGKSIETQRTSIEFFPSEDPRQIIIFMQYPEGTDIEKTNTTAKKIEKEVYTIINSEKFKDDSGYNFMVESAVSQVGEGSENPEMVRARLP